MSTPYLVVADNIMNRGDARWAPLIGKKTIVVEVSPDGFLDVLVLGVLDGGQRLGVCRERFVVEKRISP